MTEKVYRSFGELLGTRRRDQLDESDRLAHEAGKVLSPNDCHALARELEEAFSAWSPVEERAMHDRLRQLYYCLKEVEQLLASNGDGPGRDALEREAVELEEEAVSI